MLDTNKERVNELNEFRGKYLNFRWRDKIKCEKKRKAKRNTKERM